MALIYDSETSLCIIGNPSPSGASQQQPRSGRRGRQLRSIIDLANTLTPVRQTSMSEDCVLLSDIPKVLYIFWLSYGVCPFCDVCGIHFAASQ